MESTMWNHVEPIWASARICTAERTVSNLLDNLPYALPAAAPRSGFAPFNELGIAFKENDQKKKLVTQVRNPLLRRVWNLCLTCFQCLFLCGLTSFAAQCWAATCTMGATWIIRESCPKKWHCFWFLATNGSTKWITLKLGEFLQCQFWNDLPFSVQFLELQTATSRKEGPTESRPFGSLKYWTNESVSFLPLLAKVLKRNAQHDGRCVLIPNIQLLGRSSEGFTLVRFSELVGPARGISRVWFPKYKDSQSIPSKVLPNLGIPKHIAWKKSQETQGPHPLQPVQPFFLSHEQRSPAVAIKQQTACSATAGFGFSHASGARGIIVMVIKVLHQTYLYIYVDIHTFTCFKPSRLSTLG